MPPSDISYDLFQTDEAQQATGRQTALLTKLHRIARTVMHLQDIPTLAVALSEAMEDYLDTWIGLVEEEEVVIYTIKDRIRLRIGEEGLVGWVAAHGKILLANDVSKDPRYSDKGDHSDRTRSELVVPIMIDDSVQGVLDLHSDKAGAFSEADIQFAESLASLLAVAIQNARLYKEAQAQAERLAFLADMADDLTALQPVDVLLKNTMTIIGERLGYPHSGIAMIEEDELVIKAYHNADWFKNVPTRFHIGKEGIAGRVAATGEGVIIPDIRRHPEYIGRSDVVQSEMVVPIRTGERILGVINIESPELNAFTDADLRLLQTLADQVAVAIENARLYQKIQETQAQFIQSERLRAVGELAGGVAHNFNNVLTSILGYAELLLMEKDLSAYHAYLEVIVQSARQGASIAKRLRDFTRVQASSSMVAVDLNDVIEQAALITRPRWKDTAEAAGKTIEVVTRLNPVPPVTGNAPELIEVFTNLILNAVDAMPEGGVLTIESIAHNANVEVTVTDTGVGMDQATQARVFEPFFTTKGPKLGSGFGLSVAHSIMQRHNSTITVASAPNAGTTFMLMFSVRTQDDAPASIVEQPDVPPQRILVIDDEDKIQRVLVDMLSKHDVNIASSGEVGLQIFDQERQDLVFTDIGMPGLSGWNVAFAIRQMAPETVIIAITGWGDETSESTTQSKDVDFILPKPFTHQDLRQILGRAVDLRLERQNTVDK